jgi:uncharacterized membrane protein SirB2
MSIFALGTLQLKYHPTMANSYLIIKYIHVSSVTLTFILFFIRGIWRIQENPRLQQTWVKTVPHLIDTVLLFSGISLAIILHQYPGTQTWLTAKLLALLVYIIMGNIAIKRGKTKTICLIAWIGALAIFFYIVTVALTRVINPLAW